MKVVILAGGLGTRLREETEYRPKPMVQIGGRPILWHIMKIYSRYSHRDFVICLGYKGEMIRNYFLNYETQNRDFAITLGSGKVEILGNHTEEGWRVTLAETGDQTMTGGQDQADRKVCWALDVYGDLWRRGRGYRSRVVAGISSSPRQVRHRNRGTAFVALR